MLAVSKEFWDIGCVWGGGVSILHSRKKYRSLLVLSKRTSLSDTETYIGDFKPTPEQTQKWFEVS